MIPKGMVRFRGVSLAVVLGACVLYCCGQVSSGQGSGSEDLMNSCDIPAYMLSFQYEMNQGLLEAEARCDAALRELASRRFGPPSEFAVFESTCKGDCQDFYSRVKRIETAVSPTCDCAKMKRAGYFTFSCRTPVDYLCRRTGYCYDTAAYWSDFCAADSCARWDEDEDSWRASRLACSAAGTTASHVLLAGAGALLWHMWQQHVR